MDETATYLSQDHLKVHTSLMIGIGKALAL